MRLSKANSAHFYGIGAVHECLQTKGTSLLTVTAALTTTIRNLSEETYCRAIKHEKAIWEMPKQRVWDLGTFRALSE